ncbi:response regulator [Aromatoleum diolicum]|uniref:Response regulator n=1 Tax=Aromatoleum diolicum TaxID=75796 RepID=A0ABX1QF62_9RHOO|nr:response regulator [Aromatoleum diolicum]NMG75656.1 response regulator [Aromatoleum diolicum]
MPAAKRVLIVEDEEILAGNLKAHLERASCNARIAADGASAIRVFDDFAPDVLVLDYRLPDMNGFEVLDAIRCRCSLCECVLMTGHPTSEVYSGAAERGIRHILFKPFPMLELSRLVCATAPFLLAGPLHGDLAPHDTHLPVPGERRHNTRRGFPMRLFDGTWLYADRRHPVGMSPDEDKSDGD